MKQKALIRAVMCLMLGGTGSSIYFSHTNIAFLQPVYNTISQGQEYIPQGDVLSVIAAVIAAILAAGLYFALHTPTEKRISYNTLQYVFTDAGVFFAPKKAKTIRWGWDDIL